MFRLSLLLIVCFCSVAEAKPRLFSKIRSHFQLHSRHSSHSYSSDSYSNHSSHSYSSHSSSDRYSIALASAQYRAERGIKGHCSIEMGYTAGVGWASHDSNPTTCLGRGGANYAVVRGRDGWYSTKIQ